MVIVMISLFTDSVDTNIVYILSAGLDVTVDASSLFVDARAGMHLLKKSNKYIQTVNQSLVQ